MFKAILKQIRKLVCNCDKELRPEDGFIGAGVEPEPDAWRRPLIRELLAEQRR